MRPGRTRFLQLLRPSLLFSFFFSFLLGQRHNNRPSFASQIVRGERSNQKSWFDWQSVVQRLYGGSRADPSTCSSYLHLFSFSIFGFVFFFWDVTYSSVIAILLYLHPIRYPFTNRCSGIARETESTYNKRPNEFINRRSIRPDCSRCPPTHFTVQ